MSFCVAYLDQYFYQIPLLKFGTLFANKDKLVDKKWSKAQINM